MRLKEITINISCFLAFITTASAQDTSIIDLPSPNMGVAQSVKLYDPSRFIVTTNSDFKDAELKKQLSQIANSLEKRPGITVRSVLPALFVVEINHGAQKEASLNTSPFEVEGKEKKETGTLNNLFLTQLRQIAGIVQVTRNYVHQPGNETLNNIIGGGGDAGQDNQDVDGIINQVVRGEPNNIIPNDQFFEFQWNLKNYGVSHSSFSSPGGSSFSEFWRKGLPIERQVVAVLDTGLIFQHTDIRSDKNILRGYDFVTEAFSGNDGDGRDGNATDAGNAIEDNECFTGSRKTAADWHGTHVAGIAGAIRSGNQIGASSAIGRVGVLPVRVLGKCGGTLVDIVDAMLWSAGLPVDNAPANPTPATVINMSLGGEGSCPAAIQQAVDVINSRGIHIVVAAGNSAIDATQFWPAGCQNVITVAASDARGHLATYSNFGSHIDIMAPGGETGRDDNQDGRPDGVLSTVRGGFAFYQGTSMAAPHVSAAIAYLRAKYPNFSREKIIRQLKVLALPRDKQQCKKLCGVGLLNLQAR